MGIIYNTYRSTFGLLLLFLLSTITTQAQNNTCTLDLVATISNLQCNNQGTSNPNDDTFTFDIRVTGGNPWGWSGGGLGMGNYGDTYTFGPYLISNGTVFFRITDMDNPTCFEDIAVNPPAPCSPQNIPGSIGDFVWKDMNSNGIQDAGEPGLAGVLVILYDATGAVVNTDTSDDNGAYSFTNVMPGNYRIKFANPGGVEASPQNAGNDSVDSDQDVFGFTSTFTLGSGEINNTIDAGFMPIPTPSCAINIELLETICNPADRTFSVVLLITGGNPWGFNVGDFMGSYDTPTTFGPFPVSGGNVTINVVDADNPTCTNSITVEPCEVCDNVTDGGQIGNDESKCGSYDPQTIVNLVSPSGGSGAIEYMWLSSTEGCPESMADRIMGADQATYNPGLILQTTYFRRCSRRVGCPYWALGESNCVVKEVTNDCPRGSCAVRTPSNSTECGGEQAFVLSTTDFINSIGNVNSYYRFGEGEFVEFKNGTARFRGMLLNDVNSSVMLHANLTFSSRSASTNNTKGSDCYQADNSDWYYYNTVSGTLSGRGALEGANISVSNNGSARVGTGANLNNASQMGINVDLDYAVNSQPSGQVRIQPTGSIEMSMLLSGSAGMCASPQPLIGNFNNPEGINISNTEIQVYPNPASTSINLDWSNYTKEITEIHIYNLTGQEIMTVPITTNTSFSTFDISTLGAGTYFLHLFDKAGTATSKRFVVLRN